MIKKIIKKKILFPFGYISSGISIMFAFCWWNEEEKINIGKILNLKTLSTFKQFFLSFSYFDMKRDNFYPFMTLKFFVFFCWTYCHLCYTYIFLSILFLKILFLLLAHSCVNIFQVKMRKYFLLQQNCFLIIE